MGKKKEVEHNHKVKSEISKANGAWTPTAMEFSKDIDLALKKIIKKHEGKLSTDAMLMV